MDLLRALVARRRRRRERRGHAARRHRDEPHEAAVHAGRHRGARARRGKPRHARLAHRPRDGRRHAAHRAARASTTASTPRPTGGSRCWAAMRCIRTASRPRRPAGLRVIADQNEWLKDRKLAPVEEITFKSADGTPIDGFLVKPVDYVAGQALPDDPAHPRRAGVPVQPRVHGGLAGARRERLRGRRAPTRAAASGRGFEFAKAIYADWGVKDTADVLAAVDHVVKIGRRGPGAARARRPQLRRHPDRPGDRARFALQGRGVERRRRQRPRQLGRRHVHPRVRAGARPAVARPRGVRARELPVLQRRPRSRRRRCSCATSSTTTCPASARCRCTRR